MSFGTVFVVTPARYAGGAILYVLIIVVASMMARWIAPPILNSKFLFVAIIVGVLAQVIASKVFRIIVSADD